MMKIIRFIGVGLMVFGIYFFFCQAIKHYDQLNEYGVLSARIITITVTLSFVYASLLGLLAFAWHKFLELQGEFLSFSSILRLYGVTQIAKYIPGNIFHFAGRQIGASSLGLNQIKVFKATIAELAGLIISAILIVLTLGAFEFDSLHLFFQQVMVYTGLQNLIVIGLAIFAFTAVLAYVLRGKIKNLLSNILLLQHPTAIFPYLVFHLLAATVFCILLTFIIDYSLSYLIILKLIIAYVAAWLIGFVIPGSPGGIGIREAIMFSLCNTMISEPTLLILIILSRIITTMGDVIFYVVSFYRFQKSI